MSLQTPSPLCSCSTDLPLSLKHILHHQTTRTPLFVHPSCWSEAHLKFLRIVVKSLPPYPSSPESNLQIPPTSRNAGIQSGIGRGTQISHSVQEIICSTILRVEDCSNAIDREFPIFQYSRHSFPLRVGSTTTYVTPGMFVEHTGEHTISVPFLAYNDSYHRQVERFQTSWFPCTKEQVHYITTSDGTKSNIIVDPFDVSILLAMAQVQETMLSQQEMYKTFLLYPNDAGTHVHLLAAEISAGYLQCLRDPRLPPLNEDLTITHSVVPISDTRKELECLVRRILDLAPTLPPPAGWQDFIRSLESTGQSARRRRANNTQKEHGNIQRSMGWKRSQPQR